MDSLEVTIRARVPDHNLVQGGIDVNIPGLGQTRISPFKVVLRSAGLRDVQRFWCSCNGLQMTGSSE